MILGSFSIISLTLAIHCEALTFSQSGLYIPTMKIAEEIDISDVTFTTPPSTNVDHVPSITNQVVRAKPRIIVPVVTYHKVNHPLPDFFTGASTHHGKRNRGGQPPEPYKNPKLKKWKHAPVTRSNDLILAGHHGRIFLKPAKYHHNYRQRPVRPVYYLVGDDSAPTPGPDDYEMGYTKPENVKLYNEKDLQFVKPHKKNQYPKKYSPPPKNTSLDEDRLITPNISEANQMIGLSSDDKVSKGGDRVEFQMYGMDGPNSYKFGYDTGKGDNRHFRFEERDSDGKIRGHYGYVDNEGKMRIMKYEADPETGFHAGPVDYTPDEDAN